MDSNQYAIATAGLAGTSLFLHLISAGNFLPDDEVWLLGTLFWYLHYWVNFVARISLLTATAMIGIEIYSPNTITSYTSMNQRKLKKYLTRILSVACFCIFIRFIMPGPVTSFSFFYKLGFMTSLSAAVITVVEVSQAGGSPMKRKWAMRKRDTSEEDLGQEDDRKRRSGISRNSSGNSKLSFKNQ